jgi:AcrR family transcriptional regulator
LSVIIPRLPAQSPHDFATSDLRGRLASAALDLFERDGFEAATVDDIAAAVGVSRRTFFRHFQAKEDAVFADQTELLAKLQSALEFGQGEPITVARLALSSLLDDFLERSEVAHRRDALVVNTPALADREVIWWGEYQKLLGDHLAKAATGPREHMFATVIAAAMLAALRQVLTAWLRSTEEQDPRALFSELIGDVAESMSPSGPRGAGPAANHPERRDVLIISSDLSREQITELLAGR